VNTLETIVKIFELIDEIVLRVGGEEGVKNLAWLLVAAITGIVIGVFFPPQIGPIPKIVIFAMLSVAYFLILLEERRS
jgi:hypothetical protein